MNKFRLYNLEIPVDAGDKALYRAALRRVGLERHQVRSITMTKRAIDARKRQVQFNCTADVEIEPKFAEEFSSRLAEFRNVASVPEIPPLEFASGSEQPSGRIVIVGSGPAGLFAGYILARQGYKPLIVERGQAADERLKAIGRFNSGNAPLQLDANPMFGEGGAGTFSDGKLYTRKNKDPHLVNVLKLFVEYGADPDVMIDAAPHIGTDQLAPVIVAMRKAIESMGGEVRFQAQMKDVEIENGEIRAISVNGERIECAACLLAIGHSARDTYDMLFEKGIEFEAKPFQLGVRIEHPQQMIDRQQFGNFVGKGDLGAAEYFLTCSSNPEVGEVHSFCMCPGGVIIPAVHSEGELNTNGMSFSLRNRPYGNSGLVTTFVPDEFGGHKHPLAGIRFQERWEREAYQAGGGDFVCPAQPAADFLTNLMLKRELPGSYPRGRRYMDISTILPEKLVTALRYALPRFEKQMPGFASDQGIIHAVETRCSSPVRIIRHKDTRESTNTQGLYPVGEGAGYAGGIVSAALDGIHSAAAIIAKYAPVS